MKIEDKIKRINHMIEENEKSVFSGNAPDFSVLEKEIGLFVEDVRNLPVIQAKDYISLIQVWGDEIRKMSEKLNQTRLELQNEMENSRQNNKAAMAYTTANFLNNDKK